MSNTSENPWAGEGGGSTRNPRAFDGTSASSQNPWQLQQPTQDSHHPQAQEPHQVPPDPWNTGTHEDRQPAYAPPAGPPPGRSGGQVSSPPDETGNIVPESERGEQREALEQFELSHHRPQSNDDRNIETLSREFPGIDGALVAAIYGDSKDMGASREMLGELGEQMRT